MKKTVLIASIAIATLFALTSFPSASLFAQTKFIAYRSHSGIDRLFEPDGTGNFGIPYGHRMSLREEEDTISRPDTPTSFPTSINVQITITPGEPAPESVQTTPQELLQNLPQLFQPSRPVQLKDEAKPEPRVEPEIMRQPETPQGEIQVKDSVVQLEEPSISSVDGSNSSAPVTAQMSAQPSLSTPSEGNGGNQSGSLIWLALGLAFPAAMIVLYGVNQREKKMG